MSGGPYLRPLGFIWGEAAPQACALGAAIAVAGGPAACLAFEVIEGMPGNARRRIAPAAQIAASTEPALRALLDRFNAPRPPLSQTSLDRPRLMGIVNVTPDSFSDGGDFAGTAAAIAHARILAAEGADIVDIGGESTRPGSMAVDEAEELRRIAPVLEGLATLPAAISVDTRKAAVMRVAVKAGAAIINDVSALSHDADALRAAAALQRPVILMHAKGDPLIMQDNPVYEDVLIEVYDYLESRIAAAEAAGLPRRLLVADPGIGFGKSMEHNLALLAGAGLFHGLGVPVLVGASRKRFIGTITGEADSRRRVHGSVGAALAAASQGVQILRVHDVAATRQALAVWQSSMSGAPL